MVLDPQIARILLRWEDLRAQGQIVSPEELCVDCPQLIAEVKRGLQALQATCHSLDSTPQERDLSGSGSSNPSGIPLISHYKILGTLGQGGMGVVYQAWDNRRNKLVALKTLQKINPSSVYRLKQEFRALAELLHENLVELYELISTGDQCYVAMELIEGDHFLADLRPKTGTAVSLTPSQYDHLRNIFRQLVQGVSALHAHGKLHRDIKPSNVMVTSHGRVILLDFGLVADMDVAGLHQSTEHSVTGTIDYMAPEQAASQPQSEASDWYSVGVILYEALTARLPFVGRPLQILMDKQRHEPPAPAELVPDVPEALNSLCVDLLRTSAERRPAGAEILQRLGEDSSHSDAGIARQSASFQRASFVGRESQLAELREAFNCMQQGRTSVVRLHGRSGAGKSLLAQHFVEELSERCEVVVLAGKCYERESVPYKTLDSLIDSLSRYLRHLPTLEAQALLPREPHLLARVFPVLQRVAAVAEAPARATEVVDPHELRRRAFAALRELLARLGDRKPLILLIDDLQWGDVDGATQLAELLRQPQAPVLMLLACYRSEDKDTSPCLDVLHRTLEKAGEELDQHCLSVERLSHDEARELALNLLGRRDADAQLQANAIARESGGNPFFVQVLVECAGASVALDGDSLPGALALDEILWSGIQTLTDEPQRLLEVIAVSGQPIRRDVACRAAELPSEDHSTLAALRSARLIRISGSGDLQELETYHDRIRETILSHLPADTVRVHHRRIALVLELAIHAENEGEFAPDTPSSLRMGRSEEFGPRQLKQLSSSRIFDLAYHFDAAGASERAFPYAKAMADQARSQYALEIAEQLYRIAERGAEKADRTIRFEIAQNLGNVLMLRGRYPDAATRFKAALSLTEDTLTRAQINGKLAELAFKCGDMDAAVAEFEKALLMLGCRVPRWSATFFLPFVREAVVQLLHSLFPKWFLARRNLQHAESELLIIRLHNRLTYAYWFGRGKISCLWTHLRGMNLAERFPPTLELGQAYSIHAPVSSLIARFDRGISYAQKSHGIYHSLGDMWGQGQALNFYGVVLYAASRFEECIEKCRESIRLLERAGDVWEVNAARVHLAFSLHRLGNLSEAAIEAERVYLSGLELGDAQASAFSLDVWAKTTGGRVPDEILERELKRPRADIQASAQVLVAEGIRLFMLDRAEESAAVFAEGWRIVNGAGMDNPYVRPLLPWLASALRRQAEKTDHSAPGDSAAEDRVALLKRAMKVARRALRISRTFQNDLPHSLRECGLIATMQGQVRKARQYLDESLVVADRQGARFENAQTLLARGQVGVRYSWPEAERDLTVARNALRAMGADFALD